MNGLTDLAKLRTEGDIKLAKANLRHSALIQERVIADSFHNLGQYFVNSLRMAAIQTGTSILTAALVRIIRPRSD